MISAPLDFRSVLKKLLRNSKKKLHIYSLFFASHHLSSSIVAASFLSHFAFVIIVSVYLLFKNEKMGKKRYCQNVKVPRPLNAVELGLYGWVEEAVFTQLFVIPGDSLPELRHTMRLTEDLASEEDYVLEAAGPSGRLPFQADRDSIHYLWVYQELFTRLGFRRSFNEF
ncbi:hypothetical protein PIB30_030415 [Stylosanthes scabra]|uniref:Uncharacterized protein n=1 Tax=Stylosanthes scabra TaxID=79078 RepID=A0ABU6ZA38_9FABA|nr:hypothetical protein [Stylosanthes scabra]